MPNPPVVTVSLGKEAEFENRCEELICQGYKLSSTSCGFANSEQYDFCGVYQAIFVDPEVMARWKSY